MSDTAPGLRLLSRLFSSSERSPMSSPSPPYALASAAFDSARVAFDASHAAADGGRAAVQAAKDALSPLEMAESAAVATLDDAATALIKEIQKLDPLPRQ